MQCIKGEQTASFTYPTAGKEGAEAAVKILKDNKIKKEQSISFMLMTKEYIEQADSIGK